MNRFIVDRTSCIPLTDQLVSAIRTSIRAGEYGFGGILPGFRQIAASAGVSEKVVRQALRRLADDGWLRLRRGVGSEVLDPTRGRGIGRVLFLSSDFGVGFHAAILKAAMRKRIEDSGYVFEVAMAFDGRNRFREGYLGDRLSEPWDVVVEHVAKPLPRRILANSGIPFLTLGSAHRPDLAESSKCIGQCTGDISKGLPDFIREVAHRHVKSVLQVMYGQGPFDVSEMLRHFGVRVETLSVPLAHTHELIGRHSYRAMTRWLAAHPLPELVFVSDDVVAQAVLLALSARAVRIPEDVFFVSHVNRGIGVVSHRPLTRLETDPAGDGDRIGRAVVRYLRTGQFQDPQLGSVFVRGETF